MKDGNNIEKLFKDAFDQYEVDPGNQLWSKIQTEIPSGNPASGLSNAASVASNAGGSWLTTAVVGGAIVLTSVAGYIYFDQKGDKLKKQKEAKDQKELVLEQSSDAPVELDDQEFNEPKTASPTEVNKTIDQEETVKPSVNSEKSKPTEALTESENIQAISDPNESLNTEVNDPISEYEEIENDASIAEPSTNSEPTVRSINNSNSTNTADKSANQSKSNSTQDVDQKPESNDPNIIVPPVDREEETTIDISKYKFPNTFSPNGDGINDVFLVRPDEVELLGIESLDVKIYTPSGTKIYEWNGLYGSWDGNSLNGSQAPEGSYLYRMVIRKEGKEYPKQGIIVLSR